ncbi:MAG: FtsQ-type POTRA domain-containing protein [Verrucomicrobiota bacterium]|nr:FtsQ-type POTRA domain-containing protein [Verrucomicrobiota bacterium]MDP7049533.1 FtsQ-type POTRA domain-containing protein [Verrucomicrobiota bacterium]
MALRAKQRNSRSGRKKLLSVRVQSKRARGERLRWLRSLSVLVASIAAIIAVFWQGGAFTLNRLVYENDSFSVRQLDYRTDGIINVGQLEQWGGVRSGDNLLKLDLLRIKRDIELAPRVKAASVERFLPDMLQVRVAERVPMAQIWAWQRDADGVTPYDCVRLQLDETGHVMSPIDGRSVVAPEKHAEWSLPVISGIDLNKLKTLAPGRPSGLPKLQAALGLIGEFRRSPLAGVVDLRVIDLSQPRILRVTTGDGGQVDLSTGRLAKQFNRWARIRAHGQKFGLAIETVDLSVTNNVPVRWMLSPTVAGELKSGQNLAGK